MSGIDDALWRVAYDSLGVYPKSVVGGDKPYEKRTEWMEGWNAAVTQFVDAHVALREWFDALPEPSREQVEKLVLADRLMLHDNGESVVELAVLCNDTFYWGCADQEPITLEELPALTECYDLIGDYGGELWCARKRKMRPQRASYRECYPEATWSLFDACGPERTDA